MVNVAWWAWAVVGMAVVWLWQLLHGGHGWGMVVGQHGCGSAVVFLFVIVIVDLLVFLPWSFCCVCLVVAVAVALFSPWLGMFFGAS